MTGPVLPRSEESPARLWLAAALALVVAAGLAARWAHLQIVLHEGFARQALDNQIQLRPLEPPRGAIYDRGGNLLAGNNTLFSLEVSSDSAARALGKIDSLTDAVPVSEDAIAKLRAAAEAKVYKGVITLKEGLNEEEISAFLSVQFLFPEIVLRAELARNYPRGDLAAHVIGHVGRINEADKEKLLQSGEWRRRYNGAKFIGHAGSELINESTLRGHLGAQEAHVDAHGRVLARRVLRPARPGRDLHLTVDMSLQALAEKLLAGRRGAVAAMQVHTGEILALASSPRFDPNLFTFGISPEDWRRLNESEGRPLVHRAIHGQYAPGSTVKPLLALSALKRGWREEDYVYVSRGFFQLGARQRFHDWKEGGHGETGIAKSVIRSVNTFYNQLGHDVGIDELRRGLADFGLGAPTGIDLENEKGGILPSDAWKREHHGEQWYPGDTIAASVGQGYVLATPLQMARAMAMIANGGRRIIPRLSRGDSLLETKADGRIDLDAAHLEMIRDALSRVTRPGGTAPSVGRGAPYGIAGKTGTAQVARLQLDEAGNRIKNEDLPENLRDHAWFAGYAPAESPLLAVAALVENGGSGGRTAGPIVREIMDAWLTEAAPRIFAPETEGDVERELWDAEEVERFGESESGLESSLNLDFDSESGFDFDSGFGFDSGFDFDSESGLESES